MSNKSETSRQVLLCIELGQNTKED